MQSVDMTPEISLHPNIVHLCQLPPCQKYRTALPYRYDSSIGRLFTQAIAVPPAMIVRLLPQHFGGAVEEIA